MDADVFLVLQVTSSAECSKALELALLAFCSCGLCIYHYENTPIQIYRKFHLQKLKIFR